MMDHHSRDDAHYDRLNAQTSEDCARQCQQTSQPTSCPSEADLPASDETAIAPNITKRHAIDSRTCHVCGKRYSSNANMHRHLRSHSHTTPYACAVCDRRFGDSSNRYKHQRRCNSAETEAE